MTETNRNNLRIITGSAKLPGDYAPLTEHEIRKRAEWEPGSVTPAAEIVPTAPNNLPSGAVPEYRFHPTRKWRMDWAWPKHKLALEIEGGAWTRGRHTRGKGFVADLEKYNTATVMGWRILRVTPKQFSSGEAARIVRAAMEGKN